MDNQSHNFQEQQPDQKPQKPHNGLKQTAIVAVVAAVIGGGVGGGAAYFGLKNAAESSLGVTSTSQKAGTTQVSNVSVKESSSSTTAAAKVKNAVVSVVNLQKAQSTSSGLDDWSDYFGSSDSNGSSSYGSDSSGSDTTSGATTSGDSSRSSSSSSDSSDLEEYSEGSGVIYQKKDGKAYIVTNNHVVEDSDALEVILSDGTKVTAKKVGTDATTDLAVLSISASKVTTVASFGDSSALQAGQTVLAIGSPLGSQYASSVTQGIVSATSRTVDVTDEDTNQTVGQETVIQTDAAINSGNSGGPLINLSGQVIGINSMKLSSSSSDSSTATIEGMGFAIPSNEVVSIINQLVENGKVVRPALGVEIRDLSSVTASQQSSVLKLPTSVTGGAVIAGFTSGSIAKSAGLSKYDVIVGIDSDKVTGVADLRTALYKHNVNDTVKITYYHQGTKKTTNVKLTETTDSLSSSDSSSTSSSN
ncbi:S1C family serine protease [Lacticaseibacillus manihotivorans]|uniref:Trypsin-like serine protease n=2 Tax=Lacticaseibacillus manihotivorans TaxID=88233 RepID=A0A0R1QE31_9LACO|nr:trypsin-like peptidase domain-containing protein [Lacticaseibacillus manihotivorans]KRL39259.1 trypsin-like serine protease [Lacticaseibacillus manihotivorans DSM 13343 = JCM 12514]QFQ90277.1 PDZ domain-containing protein [Lacticaseibacillus manihotivorans]